MNDLLQTENFSGVMPVRPTGQSSQLSARTSSQEMMNYKNRTRYKEQLHYTVAQSRQTKPDTQKNNCTTLLPSPDKQSWTCKRVAALQCCKVLGRKSGFEKEQLHCMSCPVLASQSRTGKKITALQCCKVPGEKSGIEKEQLHCMSCPVLASQNRTCKKIIALQCCKSMEEKSDNCTALLPGV
jgi:hypothetical protein